MSLQKTIGRLKHVPIEKKSKNQTFYRKNQNKISFKVSNFFGNFIEKLGGFQKLAIDR